MSQAKYLANYAEPHVKQISDFPGAYDYACVIPCYDESQAFLQINSATFNAASSLIIVVINQPPTENTSANNMALHGFVERSMRLLWHSENKCLSLFDYGAQSRLLCIDAYTQGRELAAGAGVGLARKIGADTACQLFYDGKIISPWIFTTDADVQLPQDYFRSAIGVTNAAAFILPYRHSRPVDPQRALAIDLYELSLRYYVAGLRWAGSPYAYQTVGSTLAIHAEHYAKVRGFPKRSAGEDFYILNKLRKTGAVVSLQQPLLTLDARVSHRTPFGTGAALSHIMRLEQPERDYLFYDPRVFALLREFLQTLPGIWRRLQDMPASDAGVHQALRELIENNNLLGALHALGTEIGIRNASRQSKTQAAFLKHMHNWFDAFRTLKLLHYLRAHGYPSINMDELQRSAAELL